MKFNKGPQLTRIPFQPPKDMIIPHPKDPSK